eukprot:3030694-Lingulodinium_polyedra.AAC.1
MAPGARTPQGLKQALGRTARKVKGSGSGGLLRCTFLHHRLAYVVKAVTPRRNAGGQGRGPAGTT